MNSDNEAANILANRVTIMAINKRMDSIGLHNTKMSHLMCYVDEGDIINTTVGDGRSNTTTPYEICKLLGMIYKGTIANKHYSDFMIDLLENPTDAEKGTQNANILLKERLPLKVVVGEKSGLLEDCVHSAGVIEKNYSIAVMISDIGSIGTRFSMSNLITQVSYYAFQEYRSKRDSCI